ncbi:CHASE3 domain-containing protein [Mammaliicoccus sciuri]|uniref:CHASE3 domain-containing protein n=1 Tax=Mammaliicoccus sciuri TaxID=1296 RepID=UPI001C3D237C|nr:hypothetical protein [Mammaliicoccus sciuri]MBV5103465.1 hypothetical protein [Mammaliicoccus sciuri]MEB7436569.1 hypothetical protein [Mammaliicoccus sciuri]MEB8294536.1 hypothetical protein [Mammaliicoccus sciuri]
MFTIIFHLDFNNLIPSTPLKIFSGFIIPLLTAGIAASAIFVNYLNNRKQIKANVITKSRIEWIQDVRQCLYDLNVATNTLRFKSTRLITEDPSDEYTDAEEQYLESFTYVDASIQRLKMYFPIKDLERGQYKEKYKKYINDNPENKKYTFGPVMDDNLHSHINIRIMIDMYEKEINNRIVLNTNNAYTVKKISITENQIYKYEELSKIKNIEYIGYIKIAEWVSDYLKIEWEEAKKLKE